MLIQIVFLGEASEMTVEHLNIQSIPAITWGETSPKAYLYLHGQGGNKEEAAAFASIANHYGWQVLSIDLPEHGERKNEQDLFNQWTIVPELLTVMQYAKNRWGKIALFANSIGAWFSMLSFGNEKLEKGLFVSPVLDMEMLIQKMMSWANVSQERLKHEQTIPTTFGQTLSWKYWEYATKNKITQWQVPTKILYAGKDHLTDRDTVEAFTKTYNCELTIWETGEHWFHTQPQLDFLYSWMDNNIRPSNVKTKFKEIKMER